MGVTNRTDTSNSSIFPYVFFFMPDARVATQPPKLKSEEIMQLGKEVSVILLLFQGLS